jgi:hypothetical protein
LIEVKKKPSDDTDVVIYFDSFGTLPFQTYLYLSYMPRVQAYLLSSPALSSAEARGRRFRPTEIGSWRAGVQFKCNSRIQTVFSGKQMRELQTNHGNVEHGKS